MIPKKGDTHQIGGQRLTQVYIWKKIYTYQRRCEDLFSPQKVLWVASRCKGRVHDCKSCLAQDSQLKISSLVRHVYCS